MIDIWKGNVSRIKTIPIPVEDPRTYHLLGEEGAKRKQYIKIGCLVQSQSLLIPVLRMGWHRTPMRVHQDSHIDSHSEFCKNAKEKWRVKDSGRDFEAVWKGYVKE